MKVRDAGRIVIVGGGLAGCSAAEALRALGHAGPVVLVEQEPAAYDRPPLSKHLLEPGFTLESLALASPARLAAAGIETRFERHAAELDPDAAAVELDDGTALPADTVLLATGGRARVLPIPGADLPGVHTLRTFGDATAIRSSVARLGHADVVVVGSGLIGAEVASSLAAAGAAITLVDPTDVPLVPALGALLAEHLHAMHAAHGLTVLRGAPIGITRQRGRLSVELDLGVALLADLVVVGVGMIPRTGLAEAAGLAVDGGVLVDEEYRTSAPRVFAAGDVARLRDADGVLHRREEHWEAAQLSGKAVASAMLGLPLPERGSPWFWSDRYGVHLEATGRLTGSGEQVVRHAGAHPAVFLVDEGLLVGAAAIDDTTTVRAARRLIDRRIPVSLGELADAAVPLRTMLKVAR